MGRELRIILNVRLNWCAYMAFPMAQWQRICLQEIQKTQVQSLGIGNGNPLLYSYLGNPMDRGSLVGYSPWGHKKLDTTEQLRTHTHLHTRMGYLAGQKTQTWLKAGFIPQPT